MYQESKGAKLAQMLQKISKKDRTRRLGRSREALPKGQGASNPLQRDLSALGYPGFFSNPGSHSR
jgi:hypothetical protein